jgi:hypothetical protein
LFCFVPGSTTTTKATDAPIICLDIRYYAH